MEEKKETSQSHIPSWWSFRVADKDEKKSGDQAPPPQTEVVDEDGEKKIPKVHVLQQADCTRTLTRWTERRPGHERFSFAQSPDN